MEIDRGSSQSETLVRYTGQCRVECVSGGPGMRGGGGKRGMGKSGMGG